MLAINVSSTANGGPNTLRDAIAQANLTSAADEIVLAASLAGQTINLQQGLEIKAPVIIRSESGQVTINDAFVIGAAFDFNMPVNGIGAQSTISGLDITGFGSGIRISSMRNTDSLLISGNDLRNNASGIEIYRQRI